MSTAGTQSQERVFFAISHHSVWAWGMEKLRGAVGGDGGGGGARMWSGWGGGGECEREREREGGRERERV